MTRPSAAPLARPLRALAVVTAGAVGAVGLTLLGGATAGASTAGTDARSWTDLASVHGAATEGCIKKAKGAKTVVLVRGDNRGAEHTHLFGVTVYEDDSWTEKVDEWDARAKAGRTTKVKKVVLREADDVLVAGIGEPTGEGLGGSVDLEFIGRC